MGEGRRALDGEVRVTRDFGHRRLAQERVDARGGQTVLGALEEARSVRTRAGGRRVESIDGLPRRGTGAGREWSHFVNGIGGGATGRALAPGDVVQWDYRPATAARTVPAIVGAFPEPFLSGSEGKRIPVRLECEDDGEPSCAAARGRLTAAGVAAGSAALGAPAGEGVLRVVVARWSVARRLRVAQALERGPRASGVFARFSTAPAALELLDERGRVVRRAPSGSGLVAAFGQASQRPVWLVTGLDDAGVRAAANALEARSLRDAYAVAATPAGPVRLPVVSAR